MVNVEKVDSIKSELLILISELKNYINENSQLRRENKIMKKALKRIGWHSELDDVLLISNNALFDIENK